MKRKIDYLVIHCSATPESMDIGAETIRKWHTDKGWKDIGYHYVIKMDGTIEKGRDLEIAGAHVQGFNSKSIGICYIGGVDENMKPKDTRTEAQKLSLLGLLWAFWVEDNNIEIKGHRDFPNLAKACPSFDVQEWLNEVNFYKK